MASVHDVTIKLYQHQVIERHTHAMGAINDTNNVLNVFVVVTLLIRHNKTLPTPSDRKTYTCHGCYQ